MKRTLIAIVAALSLASSAGAATLTLDTVQSGPVTSGDNIDIIATLTLDGGEPLSSVFIEATWNAAAADSNLPNSSVQTGVVTAFGGAVNANVGTGNCLTSASCPLIDQLLGISPFPADAGVVTGELTIIASGSGAPLDLSLNINLASLVGIAASDITIGANAQSINVVPVPEPGTAAMLGLGLLGLAGVGRHRN